VTRTSGECQDDGAYLFPTRDSSKSDLPFPSPFAAIGPSLCNQPRGLTRRSVVLAGIILAHTSSAARSVAHAALAASAVPSSGSDGASLVRRACGCTGRVGGQDGDGLPAFSSTSGLSARWASHPLICLVCTRSDAWSQRPSTCWASTRSARASAAHSWTRYAVHSLTLPSLCSGALPSIALWRVLGVRLSMHWVAHPTTRWASTRSVRARTRARPSVHALDRTPVRALDTHPSMHQAARSSARRHAGTRPSTRPFTCSAVRSAARWSTRSSTC
jgi:hypothetical protein